MPPAVDFPQISLVVMIPRLVVLAGIDARNGSSVTLNYGCLVSCICIESMHIWTYSSSEQHNSSMYVIIIITIYASVIHSSPMHNNKIIIMHRWGFRGLQAPPTLTDRGLSTPPNLWIVP